MDWHRGRRLRLNTVSKAIIGKRMTSLHRTGRLRRPVAHPAPNDVLFDAYFGKDIARLDASPAPEALAPDAPLMNAASETDRLLKQSQALLLRLRQVIEERGSEE
jgi:hypothetical protein